MQNQTQLALNAAAWFFVGQSDEVGACSNVPIKTPFRIGRNPELDLYLPCQSVSGLHAEIVDEDGYLWLTDLDSTNGTFVNGRRIQSRTRLTQHDTIQFGTTVFHVSRSETTKDHESFCENDEENLENLQNNRLERLFNGGVVPFFQPIVSLEDDLQTIVGYEVLGRSKLFGLRTPAQMFAAASRLELEAELSRFLRKQGLTVADQNLPAEQMLFVNTHHAELECDGLEESLFEIRDDYPARPIMLEIHESALNDTEKFLRLRSTLDNLDIKLAFHDFGSGQIRLAELSEVAPDVVKFDVKLLQGIDKATSRRQKFVSSLVKMVKDLGISPLAECIEQDGEHKTIQEIGFQLGQGFHYGRPTSISDCNSSPTPKVKSFLADRPGSSKQNIRKSGAVPKDANWLLEQPKNHFTIQVLSAISEDRAKEHIASQNDPAQFSIFCKQGKTRMLYIVCYGIFEDRSAARTVAEQLADSTVSPWIRMLSSVHAEIQI